jgi:hypothetical protein
MALAPFRIEVERMQILTLRFAARKACKCGGRDRARRASREIRDRTMTLQEFFASLGKFVAYLGGASVVLLGLSGWIGTLLSNRIIERAKSELQKEVESHKTSLRKSEFLFEKQYEAASEFIAMRQGFLPAYRPDMDWYEACEDMAMHFDRIAKSLKAFVAKHGAIMSNETYYAQIEQPAIAA